MEVTPICTKELFDDYISRPMLTVMHFYADWVQECVVMDRILQTHAVGIKDEANFCKVNAELMDDIALKYDITSVPTMVLFRSGLVIGRVVGANAAQLNKQISQLLIKADPEPTEDTLDSRLRNLINSAPVMLFMKGNALEPKCGFSKQIVAILNEMQGDYQTFDILSDDQVRQGLKTFSDWPTYPQLYIKGELVGGLDIVKEMKENGDLAQALPKKENIEDRCHSLISSHPCMVFMKGDRATPECSFSRRLMGILKETGVEFQTFDILQDEVIRQGLKTYSDWPTYPQVYVKGTFIGGLNVIEELKETGELLSTLKGER